MGRLNAGKGEKAATPPGAQGKRPCPARNSGRPRKVAAVARDANQDTVGR